MTRTANLYAHSGFSLIGLALALAACGQPPATAPEAGADFVAIASAAPECGLEMQDRMTWGQGVTGSGHEIQEVTADGGRVLRVWSEHDAGLTADGGALNGHARAPAWIAAEKSPDGFLLYLAEGEAELRVDDDGIFCSD